MCITKTGNALLNGARKAWNFSGKAFPWALNAGFIGMDVASGNSSVGKSVGELGGGYLGWEAAKRLTDKYMAGGGRLKGFARFATNFGGAIAASQLGSSLGSKIPVYKRPAAPGAQVLK